MTEIYIRTPYGAKAPIHRQMLIEHLRSLERQAEHGYDLVVEFSTRLRRVECGKDPVYEWASTVKVGDLPTEVESQRYP